VDIATHVLASVALVRAIFPRTGRWTFAAAIVSGSIADIDLASAWFGPATFLSVRGTYTHSILGSLALAAIVCLLFFAFESKTDAAKSGMHAALAARFLTAALHLAMDACQSQGVALWWPFNARRIALDWLANLDPWILGLLIAGIAVPELLRLVGSEIGVKDKSPRGRNGAIVAFALLSIYVAARAALHSTAVAQLKQPVYQGELPRGVAAFPEPVSLLSWLGIVETESSLHELGVNVGPGALFSPDLGMLIHKPEPSAALDAALATQAARKFLRVARFPKASVDPTNRGSKIVLRDLAVASSSKSQHEVAAVIQLDAAGKVVNEEIAWANTLPQELTSR